MQRLFIIALAIAIVLAGSLGAFLFASLWPYYGIIGKVAAGVVIVGLLCVVALMLSFTWSRIGIWQARRRVIIAGEVVVHIGPDGAFTHLSAMHEQAKIPAHTIVAAEPMASDETIQELFDTGMSRRGIAKHLDIPYNRVQKLLEGK